MFENRSLQVKLVKANNEEVVRPIINSDDVSEILTATFYWGKKAAIGFVGVYAALTALNTASTIAINAAPKR